VVLVRVLRFNFAFFDALSSFGVSFGETESAAEAEAEVATAAEAAPSQQKHHHRGELVPRRPLG